MTRNIDNHPVLAKKVRDWLGIYAAGSWHSTGDVQQALGSHNGLSYGTEVGQILRELLDLGEVESRPVVSLRGVEWKWVGDRKKVEDRLSTEALSIISGMARICSTNPVEFLETLVLEGAKVHAKARVERLSIARRKIVEEQRSQIEESEREALASLEEF